MTVTLEIPDDLKNELTNEAKQLGLSFSEYALRLLYTRSSSPPKTGSELVAYWKNEGVIGTRPDVVDSQQYARRLRAAAEKRTQSIDN